MSSRLDLRIEVSDHPFDVQFHPVEQNVLASTLVTGHAEFFRFDAETRETYDRTASVKLHKQSCRLLRFLPDGKSFLSGAANGWVNLNAAADGTAGSSDISRQWRAKADAGVSSLVWVDDAHLFALGDDDGAVCLYDVRQKQRTLHFQENKDFISDLGIAADARHLVATSGDGTLAVYDIRKKGGKLFAMSDNMEDELLSGQILRDGKKVVCGTQLGNLLVFSWGDFGDMKDRILGHPASVDSIVKLQEDAVCTASSDGQVRLVTVHHKHFGSKLIGTLGEHADGGEKENAPLERLAKSKDGAFLASVAHDCVIRLWDTRKAFAALRGESPDKEAADGKDNSASSEKPRPGEPGMEKDSDDSDEDSDEPAKKKQKRKKKGNVPDNLLGKSVKANFFSDL